mmetsp:Transcript_37198/g.81458  ORF Transcript_37198/g.81458 Transcript_37198/m.81458 type:complete len:428 (+) Transcript_37198:190-1473(+)
MLASTAWRQLSAIPTKHPLAFGVGISTFKTMFSDAVVQKVVEQKEELDWKRNLAFGAFGCFYLGGVQYALYVPVFGRLFPNAASFAAKSLRDKLRDVKGIAALNAQVFLDQCVHHPLMYFPVFYMTRELVMHSDSPDMKGALLSYKENMKEDLLALWKIWVPATFFNFAFMPMWGRIPWVAGTSLLWTMVLSAMRGGDVAHAEEIVGGAVTGATLEIMKEGFSEAFTCPVELDPEMAHICVSASGPDKTGWVAMVARAVAQEGGNVTHSRMVRLGHEFIILMHVSVAPENLKTLVRSLNNDQDLLPLNIRTSSLTRRQTGTYEKPLIGFRIKCVGKDRQGMLAEISERIARLGLSVDNITTELRLDRKRDRREFVVNCDATTPKTDQKMIDGAIHDISALKEDLGLDILDIRVHSENFIARRRRTEQ